MISVRSGQLGSRVSMCVKNRKVAIFSDTINMINVRL